MSLFAITKIGTVAVPLNTFLKKEEFEYILNDCGAKMLVCSAAYAKETKDLLDTTKIKKIVWTDKYEHLDERNYSFTEIDISQETYERLAKRPSINDLACIVYTSGTTGKPKGAMLSYRNFFSNAIGGAFDGRHPHRCPRPGPWSGRAVLVWRGGLLGSPRLQPPGRQFGRRNGGGRQVLKR